MKLYVKEPWIAYTEKRNIVFLQKQVLSWRHDGTHKCTRSIETDQYHGSYVIGRESYETQEAGVDVAIDDSARVRAELLMAISNIASETVLIRTSSPTGSCRMLILIEG